MSAVRLRVFAVAVILLPAASCGRETAAFGPTLTLAESGASRPTVAVDAERTRTYVAWIGGQEGAYDVWLSALGRDGLSGEPVRVNDLPGDAAPHRQAPAQVAAGPDGVVYVAWQNNTPIEGRRFPASDLRFARSTDGGRSFSPAVTVNDDAGGPPSSHTFHDLLVMPDGAVAVSWLDGREGEAAESAMESRGGMDMGDGPGPSVRVAVSHDGGATFGPGVVVDRDTCPCCRTAMAVSDDGTLFVAWRKVYAGEIRDVVVSRSKDGGASWSAPRKVADDGWVFAGCPHAGPALAVDGTGALHVAWYTGRESGPGLYHAVSRDGGESFDAPEPIVTDAWVPPSLVSMAAAADGGVWLAWEDQRTEAPAVYTALLRSGRLRGTSGGVAVVGSDPSLATAAGAALAWLDGDAVRVRVAR